MGNSRIRNNRGFSLIETTIVVLIMGIIAYTFSQILWESKKFQNHIELKNEAGDFKRLIYLSLTSPSSCTEALFLNEDPILIPKSESKFPRCKDGTCTPAKPLDPKQFYAKSLNKVMAPGRQIFEKNGDLNPRLKIDDIRLEFLHPMADSGDGALSYIVDLGLVLGKKAEDASYGWKAITTKQPLVVEVKEEANDYRVTKCYVFSNDDGEAMCHALGGRWLSNTNNAGTVDGISPSVCPTTKVDPEKGRCVFSSTYALKKNELPDGIHCQGAQNARHERPLVCRHTKNGKTIITEQMCPARNPSAKGKKCIYDYGTKEWKFVKQLSASPSNFKTIASCDQGVEITMAPSDLAILNFDEDLDKLYADEGLTTPAWYTKQTEYLGAVTRCMVNYEKQTFKNCSNPESVDRAFAGKPGSCIFVSNIKLYNADGATLKKIQACEKMADDPAEACPKQEATKTQTYTGWIMVAEEHPRKFSKVNGGTSITEARGIPCFEVEVSKGSKIEDDLDGPPKNWDPTYRSGTNGRSIAQCLVTDNGRASIFTCSNGEITCSQVGDNTSEDNCHKPRTVFSAGSCWYAGGSDFKGQKTGVELSTYKGRARGQWLHFRSEPPPQADLRLVGREGGNDVQRGLLHSWDRTDEFGNTVDAADVNGVVCTGGIRTLKTENL